MSWLVYIAGGLQLVFGGFIFSAGRSAMHETTAAVAIGFGVLALGLGRLLQYREDDDKRQEAADREGRNQARAIR